MRCVGPLGGPMPKRSRKMSKANGQSLASESDFDEDKEEEYKPGPIKDHHVYCCFCAGFVTLVVSLSLLIPTLDDKVLAPTPPRTFYIPLAGWNVEDGASFFSASLGLRRLKA